MLFSVCTECGDRRLFGIYTEWWSKMSIWVNVVQCLYWMWWSKVVRYLHWMVIENVHMGECCSVFVLNIHGDRRLFGIYIEWWSKISIWVNVVSVFIQNMVVEGCFVFKLNGDRKCPYGWMLFSVCTEYAWWSKVVRYLHWMVIESVHIGECCSSVFILNMFIERCSVFTLNCDRIFP